jgi:hypothetical protein
MIEHPGVTARGVIDRSATRISSRVATPPQPGREKASGGICACNRVWTAPHLCRQCGRSISVCWCCLGILMLSLSGTHWIICCVTSAGASVYRANSLAFYPPHSEVDVSCPGVLAASVAPQAASFCSQLAQQGRRRLRS